MSIDTTCPGDDCDGQCEVRRTLDGSVDMRCPKCQHIWPLIDVPYEIFLILWGCKVLRGTAKTRRVNWQKRMQRANKWARKRAAEAALTNGK